MKIAAAVPYLRVADMNRSLAFYERGLGFEVLDRLHDDGGLFWARLAKDGVGLMLSNRCARFIEDGSHDGEHEHDEHGHHLFHGAGSAASGELNLVTFMYVDDADAAYAELTSRGVTPEDAPEDKAHGLREFLVRDPDGYYYAIAHRI